MDTIELLILNPNSDSAGSIAQCLVREFHAGRPIGDIHRLLAVEETQSIACSVLSELGERALPVLTHAGGLLSSPNWETRVTAVHLVFCCASEAHGELLADAVRHIEDENKRVRWRCAMLLVLVSRELLLAAAPELSRNPDMATCRELVRALLDESPNLHSLMPLATGATRTTRLAAVIAALRAGLPEEQVRHLSEVSKDAEVQKLAKEELQMRRIG